MATASDLLEAARAEIGYSRWDDPEEGSKYGRWYAQLTGEGYYGTSGVPYCAMFVSWCLAQAGVEAPGFPGAYCPWILDAGRAAGRTPYNEDAQPGDLVLFDWQGDGVADHIGIVEANWPSERRMQTIEGNTSPGTSGSQSNGGGVYRRVRSYGSIIGIVRPYWGAEEEEEEDMTPEQSRQLERIYEQVNGTYDPTGRGVELNDHDHIKWLGAAIQDANAKIDAMGELLSSIAEKVGAEEPVKAGGTD